MPILDFGLPTVAENAHKMKRVHEDMIEQKHKMLAQLKAKRLKGKVEELEMKNVTGSAELPEGDKVIDAEFKVIEAPKEEKVKRADI